MNKKCLFDMSDVDASRVYYSINLYKYRLLEALTKQESSTMCLLFNSKNFEYLRKRFAGFNYIVYTRPHSFFDYIPIVNRIHARKHFADFVNNSGCDCFFSASNIDYKITSKFKIHKVVVVHDIKAIWEGHGFLNKLKQRIRVSNYYKNLINNSSIAIAISNYTRQNILKNIKGVLPYKLNVVYNSVVVSTESEEIKNLPINGYILYVNTLDVYKNLGTLVKAYCIIKDRITQDLVIVGNPNDYWNLQLLPYIKKNNIEKRVHLLSNLSDTRLRYLYENAKLFVSPSLNEGFGYTPLEAAICECPVICSKCEALPDTTRGKLNYYENALDENELANKICCVLNSMPNKQNLKDISDYFRQCYSPQKQKLEILQILNMRNKE